jgi:hypothetical protein
VLGWAVGEAVVRDPCINSEPMRRRDPLAHSVPPSFRDPEKCSAPSPHRPMIASCLRATSKPWRRDQVCESPGRARPDGAQILGWPGSHFLMLSPRVVEAGKFLSTKTATLDYASRISENVNAQPAPDAAAGI